VRTSSDSRLSCSHVSNSFLAILVLLVALPTSCSHPPDIAELSPHYDRLHLSEVPIILVGQALENSHAAAPIVPSRWDGYPRQLWKTRVRVERVLQGPPISGDVDIFYFTGDQIPGSVSRLFAYAGHYEIFFLQKDNGHLRTICEDRRTCVYWVRTGAHPDYKPDPNLPIEAVIADLLLTRGPNTNDRQVIDAIYHARNPETPLAPLRRKLKELAAQESLPVRAAAQMKLRDLGTE